MRVNLYVVKKWLNIQTSIKGNSSVFFFSSAFISYRTTKKIKIEDGFVIKKICLNNSFGGLSIYCCILLLFTNVCVCVCVWEIGLCVKIRNVNKKNEKIRLSAYTSLLEKCGKNVVKWWENINKRKCVCAYEVLIDMLNGSLSYFTLKNEKLMVVY